MQEKLGKIMSKKQKKYFKSRRKLGSAVVKSKMNEEAIAK